MNLEQLKKNIGRRVQLRPVAYRLDENGRELESKDDDWAINNVTSDTLHISNTRTNHVAILGKDHVHHFTTNPNRSESGLQYGFLTLNVQIYLQGNKLRVEPNSGPGQRVSPDQATTTSLEEVGKSGPEKQLQDWVQSCQDRLNYRMAMELTPERRIQLSAGRWTAGYVVSGSVKPLGLKELKELLERIKGKETGWPPWWVPTREEIAPFVTDGLIECWLKDSHFEDPAHSDFWRASPNGMLFLSRGYHEDGSKGEYAELGPKQGFDLTLPIRRIGECLLHAARFSQALAGNEGQVFFQAKWEGLSGRKLYWRDYGLNEIDHHPARQHAVTSKTIKAKGREIEELLEELVDQLTKPLYELFDFYRVPRTVISTELKKMRERQA